MDPLSTDQMLAWKLATAASAALSAILGAIGLRTINRLDALKEIAVTHPQLQVILRELREDRQGQHQENKDLMQRLENRMEALHRESNDRRHNLIDRVQELSLTIGQLARKP